MSKYTCEKCEKEFKQKCHYVRHINKKNSCNLESKIKNIIVKEKIKKLHPIKFDIINENEVIDKNKLVNNIIPKSIEFEIINEDVVVYENKLISSNIYEEVINKTQTVPFKQNIDFIIEDTQLDMPYTTSVIDQSPLEIKYIDLFCGLGAFHSAFNFISNSNIKYKCIFACDIDDNVRKIYKANHKIEPLGDINDVNISNIPDFDILCGGFPCQPFSIAGKKEGFDDKIKGNLFFSILKIIDIKNPNTIILENVKNLLSINKGDTFKTIKVELEKRGYIISHKIIDSKYYNSPQSRQRLFIIGNKTKSFIFPEIKNDIISVSNIIDNTETRFLNYNDKYKLEKCNDSENKNNCKMLYKLVHKKTNNGGRQGERIYSINHCGPTICASSGGPGAKTGLYYIDNKVRRLNAMEGLRMFGFDNNYIWNEFVKEEDMLFYLGNSIVVDVLKIIIKSLELQYFIT
jgi:DNA (cytosine-5)-methyltransferase 1